MDYATPELIEKSFFRAKRCGSNDDEPTPPLPNFRRGATYSVVTVGPRLITSSEELVAGNGDFRPVLHMPLHNVQHLDVLPSKLSYLEIFLAVPSTDDEKDAKERIGVFVIAPESVMPDIESCGIVEEIIAEF